ncbi:MAG TPA: methylated-DNA--[protein]-cysteine S-methyltransferase [Gemmatimonadaceae bacterium]|jgi:AraC family transcriptional regulator of adaptative response/methylated-DNA-[protein]-cysteine methyltransferase
MTAATAAADYERIARAISYLDAHWRDQPSLADVARHIGLSESHFQRLFTRWVGISPKRFLQQATAQFARSLLREHRAALPTTLDAGLSNPSRLHELIVHAEAMTPGQLKRGGQGVEIAWGFHPSPLGTALVAVTPLGICSLQFADTKPARFAAVARLRAEWPAATLVESTARTRRAARQALGALGTPNGPLALHVRGTNFQLKVWTALLNIAPGTVTTYEEIAGVIGQPRAVRAVGSAVGRNPVSVLIPCHRVIRKSGGLGGYAWGLERKEILLRVEDGRGRTADGG